jgi:hypothetical protein
LNANLGTPATSVTVSALFDGRASGGKSILMPSALTLPRLDLPDLDFTGAWT